MNYAIDELIDLAQTVIQNATHHQYASSRMAEFGYHQQRIEEGQQLLNRMLALQMQQEDCYSSDKGLRQQLHRELSAVTALYREHVEIARFAFRHDAGMQARLELTGPRKRSQARAVQQIRKFYMRAEESLPLLKKFGLKADEFAQSREMIEAIAALRVQRRECMGNAQDATQQRNNIKKELQTWLADFRKVARVALKEDPQLLEIFHIRVPSI